MHAPAPGPTASASRSRRKVLLWGLVALGIVGLMAGVFVLGRVAQKKLLRLAEPPSSPVKLEIVNVDDDSDPLEPIPVSRVPAGISLSKESAPVGRGRTRRVTFARTSRAPGETTQAAVQRLKSWLDTVPLDPGKRFGVAEVDDYGAVGVRSYLLTGEALVTETDVEDAEVSVDAGTRQPYVLITLSADGAQRFEAGTAAWVDRRMAIVLDGTINSAPVVKSKIGGGRASITMGTNDDPEKTLADARRLASGLRATHQKGR